MKEMEKRELIILGIMAVVVLYGAFTFLAGKSRNKTSAPPALSSSELKTMAGDLAISMARDILTPAEAYTIARAEAEWLHDPFYERKAYRGLLHSRETTKTGVDTAKKITFNYTGYIEYGGRKMAIINGLEYTTGDGLETKGYMLRQISLSKVTIENTDSRVKIEVPIEE